MKVAIETAAVTAAIIGTSAIKNLVISNVAVEAAAATIAMAEEESLRRKDISLECDNWIIGRLADCVFY
jgi:hypothetical protein